MYWVWYSWKEAGKRDHEGYNASFSNYVVIFNSFFGKIITSDLVHRQAWKVQDQDLPMRCGVRARTKKSFYNCIANINKIFLKNLKFEMKRESGVCPSVRGSKGCVRSSLCFNLRSMFVLGFQTRVRSTTTATTTTRRFPEKGRVRRA